LSYREEVVMTKPPESLLDRWSWLEYPLAAVMLGGLLGRIAGRQPCGSDPFLVLSNFGSAFLIDGFLIIVAFTASVGILLILLCLIAGDGGIRSRLMAGFVIAAFVGFIVLVFSGGAFVVCCALAVLSLWAGVGAGPFLGAILGATSVAVVIALGGLCLSGLGRFAGRLIVKKQVGKRPAITQA
jgi:hypothetical protein